MKKIKFILPVCLGLVALVACDQIHGQPDSNFYKISFVNVAEEDTDKPEITFESSNLIEKGKDCDLLIRFAPYSTFNKIEGEDYLIRQSSLTGDGPILNKNYYSFTETETVGVYRLQIPKEYMTTSYDIVADYTYVKYGAKNVIPSKSIEKDVSVVVTNSSVNHDLTFHVMPNNFQAGATFDATSKDNIKIIGVDINGGETDLTQKLSRKELVHIDSSIQGISHYHTDTKSLRCAIPMEHLYEPAAGTDYGYKKKYEKIVVSTDASTAVSYDKEHYLNLFNIEVDETSCMLTREEIVVSDGKVYYEAAVAPNEGYYFGFPITDIVIQSNTYAPTGHPYFRDFMIHSDKSGNIQMTPSEAYSGKLNVTLLDNVVEDKFYNIYAPMESWMTCQYFNVIILPALIQIDITEMVKYTQLPTSTIISTTDLLGYEDYRQFYKGGSIDFIKSINIKVAASK